MLQGMDSMDTSCIFYGKIGMFNHLEQSKFWLLTVSKAGLVKQIIQHDLIVSVSFMYYPGDFSRQTFTVILSVEECPIDIRQ